jgi:type IV secretion system protein VirB8
MAAHPGRIGQLAAMNDIPANWRALPIRAPALEAHYAEVRSYQAERAARANRRTRLWGTLFAASMTANVALASAVAILVPNQRLVPMPLILQSDGTWDTAASISSLPATQEEAVIRAAIWRYVWARESYSWPTAGYYYDLVTLMSAPATRDIYQAWFLPRNKASPQLMVGKKGQIDVAKISMSFVRPQMALIRFRRVLQYYGQSPEQTTWTATVEFGLEQRMTMRARDMDPGGILVTRYSSSQDSATP